MSAQHIGSRGSDLALWQSRTVLAALHGRAPAPAWHPDITVITTRGDLDQSPFLAGSVEKGFFTSELEVALLERRIDLVVHSLKDLPTATPEGLHNRTILPRATAADWLLIRREFHEPRDDGLLPLKPGARVGASSLRRGALARPFAPQAHVGAAARQRADAPAQARRRRRASTPSCSRPPASRASHSICPPSSSSSSPPEWWVPAPGQGALAAQCRAGDAEIDAQIAALADRGLCRCDALGARIPARHRRRLLHAFRLPRRRQARASRHRHRARLGGAQHRTTDKPIPREDPNVTHSSAQPSPAASPSTLSETAARALGRAVLAR